MELPASFIDYTRALLGDEEYDKLAVALQQEPPVSIRLNQLKINHSLSDKVPWSSEEDISTISSLAVFRIAEDIQLHVEQFFEFKTILSPAQRIGIRRASVASELH